MATSCVGARRRLNSHCQNEPYNTQAVFRIKTESISRLTPGTLTGCFANASLIYQQPAFLSVITKNTSPEVDEVFHFFR